MTTTPQATPARRRTRAVVLLVLVGALAAAALALRGTAALAVAAAASAGAAVVGGLVRGGPSGRDGDDRTWRWAGGTAWLLTAGLVAEVAVAGAGGPGGVAFTVGVLLASGALYHGLVHWNRIRTELSDPGDWLNGVSAGAALLALGDLVLRAEPGTAGWWALQLGMVRVAALLVALGTTGTVLAIAGLRRDVRAWVLTAGLAVVTGVEIVALLAGPASAEPAPAVVVAWTGLAVLVAGLRVGRARALPPREAASQDTTLGSLVVMGAGVGILVVAALVPGDQPVASVLAAAAAVGGGARVLRLVTDLAQLATVRQEARTDPLTGVANRRALLEQLGAVASGPRGALLVIDLDRFKEVNDRFGHAVGDGVIRSAAARLAGAVDGRGVVARLGGDEFAVALPDADEDAAVELARVVLRTLTRTIGVEGRVVRLEASIGVATTAVGARDAAGLLRRADAAMYDAKQAGGGVRLYDRDSDARARAERRLVDELRQALDDERDGRHGRITVHLQPQVDLADGRVVAAEALVRWEHPERGVLAPAAFLALAEEHGLMGRLTRRVLDQATRAAAGWAAPDGHAVRVAVNLSTSCLDEPGLLELVDDALARAGLPADRLVLEITETALMHDPERAVEATHRLAERGIGLSIDDYGTGYSSLAYLNDLPAEELKLDRSFTARALADPRTRAIVAGTVELAHHLGLRLVAEGVEDRATEALLRGLGCDRVQGYLHARPMPVEAFASWLDERRAVPPAPVSLALDGTA
ncbi:putative bifunctional diguanylate cyclase/phosphodiesterase [Cellulosimicrobium cellulans]|uniref:putative bifunctional diguanylate cyclase/phosphodiesterase n=1 Tax=Cellulosimicrobium cellulans TaxID=1710 RepID=UPI00130D820C|nr:bifunctional diguanylate cyclase/phosphodiesterase [Cellulosimicrobium cellulans]